MPSKQLFPVSQRHTHCSAAQKKKAEQQTTNSGGRSAAAPLATHLATQQKATLGIQQSPYAVAQRQRMVGLTQRQAPKADEDELSHAAQTKADPVQRLDEEDPAAQTKRASVQLQIDEGPTKQGKFVAQRNIDEDLPATQKKSDPLQRFDEEEHAATQVKADPIQRLDEDDPHTVQPETAGTGSPNTLREADAPARANNTGLPDKLKAGIESLSGLSMDGVKVHYNSDKPARLNALAYAQGTDIHVGPGQEQHLPHEAWHVVQQAQGRVQPTMQMNGGVPVNDDAGLEHEADVMGGKALPFSPGNADTAQRMRQPATGHAAPGIQPSPAQRRLADPANLGTATAAVVSGARSALVETALDIYRSGAAGQTYVTTTLGLRTTRTDMTADVAELNVDNLKLMIARVRTDYPGQVFDSANFDVKPTQGSLEATYVTNLVTATLLKMQAAADNGITLRSIFGDGDPDSGASRTAATTARNKILAARTRLNGFLNIYIDSSGVSRRVGIGGYANFDRKIFLLVADVNAAPSNAAICTLFHESMHLAHAEIHDEGGYSNTGTRFSGAQVQEKLTNADHYAEVAKVLDGETTHALPFTPAALGGGAAPAARTNRDDTADTMAVRNNVMHRCRQLWSGAADYFMKAVSDKRNNDDWWNRKDTSTKLNMTYHNKASFFDTPQLNETDLSLAEGTVNRFHRFTNAVTAKMKNAADGVFTAIRNAYNAAAGNGDAKRKQAGKDVLVAEGTASTELAPQDKTPSVTERFDSISR